MIYGTVESPGRFDQRSGRSTLSVARDGLLLAERVTCVAMESTSDYWRGAFYLLEDTVGEVMLVNPAHVRNVPGCKTDALDAAWLRGGDGSPRSTA